MSKLLNATFALSFVAIALAATDVWAAKYHHVHLTTTDPAEAAKWYADTFDGNLAKLGPFQITQFGNIAFVYFKKKPGFEGSEGSSVDHIGFSFPDVEERMAGWKEDGVKIVQELRPIPGTPIKYGFLEDPWGTKIEVLSDPDLEGFHHVHLHSPDPEATIEWYTTQFGGEAKNFADLPFLPAIRYEDMWVIVQKVGEAKAATKGRAIDHISWSFPDLAKSVAELKDRGVKVIMGPIKMGAITIAFIEGPDGVLIELVESP